MAKLFKGIRKVSKNKYKQLHDTNALDDEIMYVTPEVEGSSGIELKDSETIKVYEDPVDGLTELMIDTGILNDINMSLRLPASSPASIELVGVDNTKSQKMIELGEGLVLDNGVLKATGSNGTTNVPNASNSTAGIIKIATDAEASSGTNELVAVNPKQLKTAIDGLGTVFDLKGTKSTTSALPASGNTIGDVWYVTSEQVAYIWLNDGTSTKWEQFGAPIDLSGYIQTTDIVNNLTSTDSTKPLSAAQGKNLYTMQTNLSNELGTINNTLSTIETTLDNTVILNEGEVISKKRLIWSGELKYGDGEIVLSETVNYNDIYEIQYKWGNGIYFEKFQIRPMINSIGQIESIKISRVNVDSGAFVRFNTAEIQIELPDNTFEVVNSYYVYQLLSGQESSSASKGADLEFIVQKIWKVIEE